MSSSSTNSGVAPDHRHVRRHAQLRTSPPSTCRTASTRRSGGCRPKCASSASPSRRTATASCWRAGVYAEKGEYDSLFLSNYIDVYVKDALKRVPGVGRRAHLRRAQLLDARCGSTRAASRHRGLTAGDVVNALREQNVHVAAGSVGDAPAPPGQTYQISVRAAGRLLDAQRVRRTSSSRPAQTASLVRLSDVGRVELGAESYSSLLRFQGIDAVGFGVIALPTANALDVEPRRRRRS